MMVYPARAAWYELRTAARQRSATPFRTCLPPRPAVHCLPPLRGWWSYSTASQTAAGAEPTPSVQADATQAKGVEDPLAKENGAPMPEQADLLASVAEKDKQIAEYKDLYLRARADFDNLQKRTDKEKQAARDFALQSFAKQLVSDLDVLDLAINSVDKDQRAAAVGMAKELLDGVESTRRMLEQTLARFGVVSFNPEGEDFDPNKHEALFRAPIPGKDANTVVCQKTGWTIHGRILRPAQVGVVE